MRTAVMLQKKTLWIGTQRVKCNLAKRLQTKRKKTEFDVSLRTSEQIHPPRITNKSMHAVGATDVFQKKGA